MHDVTHLSTERRPTIFLLEEDPDVNRLLKDNLRRLGYRVLAALDLEDALEWVSGVYIHADLVLVNLVGKTTEEALDIGRILRAQAKYDGLTPLVVMCEKYGTDVEGTDVNVGGSDWITYPEDGEQLRRLIARLTNKDAAPPTSP